MLFFSAEADAQFSMDGMVSFQNMFGGSGLKNFGLGIKAEYALGDKTVITGGFKYYLPSNFEDYTYGYAYSSQTNPSQIEIETKTGVSFLHLTFGGKRYFVGDYEDNFGLYGIGEAGMLFAPVKTTITGNFDPELYYTTFEDGEKETLSNFTIGFGLGFDIDLDFGYLFTDLKLNLPANQVNGQTVSISIPPAVAIDAGIRIPF